MPDDQRRYKFTCPYCSYKNRRVWVHQYKTPCSVERCNHCHEPVVLTDTVRCLTCDAHGISDCYYNAPRLYDNGERRYLPMKEETNEVNNPI